MFPAALNTRRRLWLNTACSAGQRWAYGVCCAAIHSRAEATTPSQKGKRRGLNMPSRVLKAHERLFFDVDAPAVWSEATGFIGKASRPERAEPPATGPRKIKPMDTLRGFGPKGQKTLKA